MLLLLLRLLSFVIGLYFCTFAHFEAINFPPNQRACCALRMQMQIAVNKLIEPSGVNFDTDLVPPVALARQIE